MNSGGDIGMIKWIEHEWACFYEDNCKCMEKYKEHKFIAGYLGSQVFFYKCEICGLEISAIAYSEPWYKDWEGFGCNETIISEVLADK